MTSAEGAVIRTMQRIRVFAAAIALLLSAMVETALAFPVQLDYTGDLPSEIRAQISERMPDEPNAESALHARRQARRAKTLVEGVLNAYGYFDPTVQMRVVSEGGEPRPSLSIDPGAQFSVRRIVVRYEGEPPRADDQTSAENAITLQPGARAVAAQIIDVERQVGSALRGLGYPYANAVSRDVIGDKDAKTISVRYNVSSGPRVKLGEFIVPEGLRTRTSYLRRINPLNEGELFEPAGLALYNSRLGETRLFDSSLAKLSDEPTGVTEEGDEIRNVVLDLTERDRHTLTLGAGYDTSEGFGIEAELLRRNLTRRGDLLIGEATLSQREIGLDVIWRQPNVLGYGRGLSVFGSAKDENTDAFDQQTAKLGVGVDIIQGPQLRYGFGADVRYIRQNENGVRRDFQVASTNASLSIDRADSILDPRRGWRAEASVKPTYSLSPDGPDVPYVRATGQARLYLPLDSKARFVAAGRVRLGTLVGAQATNVPGEDRFYAGGGGSVRGYGFQAIGPFDADDDPLGGRSLAEASLEGRARISDNIGAVLFLDAGNISDETYPRFDNLRLGLGAGVRYQTPAGPIRLDVATPINPTDNDPAIQVYISIGQAF